MRYWILPAIVCWALVISMTAPEAVLRDGPFQDQMTAAIVGGIITFIVFGFVQKAIRERGLRNWPSRVAFRALQREPPMLKLNGRLLVDEQLQPFVGATGQPDEGNGTPAHSADVQRLYKVLDE